MAEHGEFDDALDRGGRYKKVYKDHVDPLKEWREEHFVKRYRLSKARISQLAVDFSPWSRTDGTSVGGGLSYSQQVCIQKGTICEKMLGHTRGEKYWLAT